MNNQRNSGAPLSSFDQDFGSQHFEPVEETVVIDGDIAAKLVDRRRPGDPELAQRHRLLVVDPTGEEWEYAIDGELMIGRAEDNHIALPDRAVSRHHLAVNTDGQLYWFQDLNSGNGTQVNNEFMKEGWLTGGEEIVVGNSHIYFLVPEIEAPPELAAQVDPNYDPAHPEQQGELPMAPIASSDAVVAGPESESKGGAGRLLALLFVLLVIGGAGVAGWWVYQQFKSKSQAKPDNAVSKKKRPDQEALQLFEKGKELMKQGQWEKADAMLRKAATIIPGSDPMRVTILQYSNLVGKELTAHHLYKQAVKLYNQDKTAQALSMLQRIPMTSKVFKKAEKYRERIHKRELKPKMLLLRYQLESKRTADAMKTLGKILAIAPRYQPALKIKRQLEAGDVPTAPKAAVPKPKARRNPYGNSNALPAQLAAGKSMFCQGQYAQAVVYFRQQQSLANTAGLRKRAALFRERVETFENMLNKGVSSARRRRISSAIRRLKKAKKYDETYFGGCRSKSYKRWLSRMYYKRSRRYYRRRRYRAAARKIRQARRLAPRSRTIRRASASIRRKAKRLINEAKVLIGIDNGEARKYLKQALGMLPSGDPLHNRAKRLLSRAQ